MSVDVALGGHCGIQITVFIADLAKSLSLPTQSYLTHQSHVEREYDDNLMYYTPARNYSSTSVYLSNTVLRVNLFIDENVQLRIKMRVLPTLSKKRRGNRNDFQSLSPLSSPPVIYPQLQYLTLNFVLQDGFSTTTHHLLSVWITSFAIVLYLSSIMTWGVCFFQGPQVVQLLVTS